MPVPEVPLAPDETPLGPDVPDEAPLAPDPEEDALDPDEADPEEPVSPACPVPQATASAASETHAERARIGHATVPR